MVKTRVSLVPCILSVLLCLVPLSWAGALQDGDDPLAHALYLRENNKDAEALQLFETILKGEPDNYHALLNAAFLHFRQGWLYGDNNWKKEHYFKLADYAGRAYSQNPTEYQAQLLHIVARGKTARYLAPGDQVRIARELHRELTELLASGRNDPDLIYILSWLNFKVGKTGSLERLLASMLFGGLPEELTTDNAVMLMEKAIELRPDYVVYAYDLGLFRQRLGQPDQARALFEKALTMEPKTVEEAVYGQWAGLRLQELEDRKVASK